MITASLDIGSEKMVMALAERGQETCRLLSIKYQGPKPCAELA